jgi:3-hydroxybutyryl-CoA dehydrogenase
VVHFGFSTEGEIMRVNTVAVIGAGIMGRGIAHVAAMGGLTTILNDVSLHLLNNAKERIRQDLKKGVEIGKVSS